MYSTLYACFGKTTLHNKQKGSKMEQNKSNFHVTTELRKIAYLLNVFNFIQHTIFICRLCDESQIETVYKKSSGGLKAVDMAYRIRICWKNLSKKSVKKSVEK